MCSVLQSLKRLLLVLLSAGVGGANGLVCAEPLDAAAVKVAFIYNFINFIEWPDSADTQNPLNVCATEDAALQGSLSVLQRKMLSDRPIVVREGVVGETLKTCQLVYVSGAANVDWIVHELKNQPIVTVSDHPDFVQRGGGLGLINDGNRIGFEVNLDATNAAGLHVSAQLLKLAKIIKFSQGWHE